MCYVFLLGIFLQIIITLDVTTNKSSNGKRMKRDCEWLHSTKHLLTTETHSKSSCDFWTDKSENTILLTIRRNNKKKPTAPFLKRIQKYKFTVINQIVGCLSFTNSFRYYGYTIYRTWVDAKNLAFYLQYILFLM